MLSGDGLVAVVDGARANPPRPPQVNFALARSGSHCGRGKAATLVFTPFRGVAVLVERLTTSIGVAELERRMNRLPAPDRNRLSQIVRPTALIEACRSAELLLQIRRCLVRRRRIANGAKLLRTAAGRPVFCRSGGRPLDVNLSHGGGYIALALSCAGAVGIDLEPPRRASAVLVEDVCTAAEADWLEAAAGDDASTQRFARLWTHKEALTKAVGCGLSVDPTDIEFAFGGIEARLLRSPFRGRFAFRSLTLATGVALAICLDRGVPNWRYRT